MMSDKKNKKTKIYDTKKSTNLLIVISAVLLLGIGGMVIYNVTVTKDRNAYMQETENSYELSFYELIQGINDIEGKLGKLVVSSGLKTQKNLLNEINKLSAVSISHLSHLLQRNDGESRIIRFVNQIGDYTEYLYRKNSKGEALTDEERDKLEEIQEMVRMLGVELSRVQNKMDEGYKLINGYSEKDAFLRDIFDGLNSETVEYPQMIYDGPFSDGANKDEAKGLSGADVTADEAKSILNALFGGKGIVNTELLNEADGVIPVYNFSANIGGNETYISVTKKGGKILNMNTFRSVSDTNLSDDDCVRIAAQFIGLLGFENMKDVWVSNYDGIAYVNFAYENDGVIYYPDLIKIKVASDNGDILGIEAGNYLLNHTDRTLDAPAINAATAAAGLSKKLIIEYVRLALIPIEQGEKLCYEFYCEYDDAQYFVYIDAETGEEVNILRVIDSGNGRLLY
ncbi:MAG: germination protein YpeB [Clostridiales bacterium]|jgi:germination protein YpeB|nr:germination protein YpeB [Clostridiales bacterium]